MAQALTWPQSGQSDGSTVGAAGFMGAFRLARTRRHMPAFRRFQRFRTPISLGTDRSRDTLSEYSEVSFGTACLIAAVDEATSALVLM